MQCWSPPPATQPSWCGSRGRTQPVTAELMNVMCLGKCFQFFWTAQLWSWWLRSDVVPRTDHQPQKHTNWVHLLSCWTDKPKDWHQWFFFSHLLYSTSAPPLHPLCIKEEEKRIKFIFVAKIEWCLPGNYALLPHSCLIISVLKSISL